MENRRTEIVYQKTIFPYEITKIR